MAQQSIKPGQNDLDSASAEVGEALAHPTRIAILRLLVECGEQCSCEIEPCFSVDASVISRHLAVLRRAGLIVSRRDGVRTLHRLASPHVVDLLALVDRIAAEEADASRLLSQRCQTQYRTEVKKRAALQGR